MVVNGDFRWRKVRIRECTHCDADSTGEAFFCVKDGRPAHRTESKPELRALVAGTHVLSGFASHLVRLGKAGERSEHTAGPLLAGEAVTNTDAARLAMNLNLQLPTATRRGARRHRLTPCENA